MIKPQLFLIHYAGGNSYSFQFLTPFLKDFEVIVPELPGRGRRVAEELLPDFEHAADDMYALISKKITSEDYIIYGHSLGAYLGFRVSQKLEQEGRAPAYLLVSGNPGPGAVEIKNRYLMEATEFIRELKLLGGIPKEFLESEELMEFFDPILRADFKIAEQHRLENSAPVNIPMYAMMGSEEEGVDKIENWGRFTTAAFKTEIFTGDHFFIQHHPQRLAEIIRFCYNRKRIHTV
ncbi:surfactin synthase thioesterase subunit [Chitinophaga dinghuensis]|uniref:Surfactin synthase thioesterase subunit n=1 Tax=Chitinophaga dinghuensis TaxID=1539050 RepID=A0A327VK86_9BACT|nr:alpha/beta fold hydrolase [Chitinophaga dinghuensis]RAJ72781.1 surfactin synthase thioesterase subunit [Chitinophaga dinghuensis]